ncbi:hypothetical protein [Trebonia sp.]|uniref:hypothetical protein n=1 Tax=Trebonia sp. TaxID=2767075 RepID=UPI00261A6912|nr:hypothetical protein [Trebonia sp.]
MRSGWPHTQDDHGRLPPDGRQVPFGPDISWPTGYSDLEYRGGDYRYPASRPPAPSHGEHPYAAAGASGYGTDPGGYARSAADDFGYGDPGYANPGYNGPASQDAGIAGTRTVRGYVEPGQPPQPGYGQAGYVLSAPTGPAPARAGYGRHGYTGPGYMESTRIELAYPHHEPQGYGGVEAYSAADTYRQPWDYDQPLRYEGEEQSYQAGGGYADSGGYPALDYPAPGDYGRGGPGPAPYDPADYNGSAYSRPGIDGPGYDLSGIIGTGDFEAVGYDEPSYGRLSYDDPRYDRPRFDETRFDVPRFDETRLDSLWADSEDIRQDEPVGYGNDGFDTGGPDRSGYPDYAADGGDGGADFAGRRHRFADTRYDLRVDDLGMDHTRFDVPAYDETRIDSLRSPRSARSATGLLAPADDEPLDWDEPGEFDFLDLDDDRRQVPAAFSRTAQRRRAGEDTGTRRAAGRRRGRSGDRRQWMALGAIAVVAAGAIGGVLMKYVFSGPSGPAHTIVAPDQVDGFTRMPNLEKEMKVSALANEVMSTSAGQASDVVSAVYQMGSSAPGGDAQIFMFVGGKLSSAAPATSIANFTQTYPGANVVPAGSLGGEAACAEAQSNDQGVAMCVWFDNDSFGELVSPTMTTAKLATTLDEVRPSLELYAK